MRSYDVGKLYKTQVEMFVLVPDCGELERRFSLAVDDYKVRKRKEIIKASEAFVIDVLKMILLDNTTFKN